VHARLRFCAGELEVEDLDSTNGTLIDGRPVRKAHARFGDELRLGAVSAALHLLRPRSAAAELQIGEQMVARNPRMRELLRVISLIAPKPMPVLITGETGVGKEVLVGELHRASKRPGPLVVQNCAAIPRELTESLLFGHERGAFTGAERRTRGVFEQAHGGTLFLDEIGDLALSAQAALLRVLQEKRFSRVGGSSEIGVDVRVVAATHHDLERCVAAGSFRDDLLYRLNAVTLSVPPLRDRRDEIEPLARHFLREASAGQREKPTDFSGDAIALLRGYTWPGNIRQLRNIVERAVAVCDSHVIGAADLPSTLCEAPQPARSAPAEPCTDDTTTTTFRDRVRDFEITLIDDALRRSGGSVTRAAALLRMPLRTLTHKMKAYGLRG
jgi:DNA-binding NtrC family response regulator